MPQGHSLSSSTHDEKLLHHAESFSASTNHEARQDLLLMQQTAGALS